MDAPSEPAGASATHSARAASTASLNVLLWATLMALWADAFCVRWLWKFEKPFTHCAWARGTVGAITAGGARSKGQRGAERGGGGGVDGRGAGGV